MRGHLSQTPWGLLALFSLTLFAASAGFAEEAENEPPPQASESPADDSGPAENVPNSKAERAEDLAFEAAEEGRFCDASHAFFHAYALKQAADLLYNAARAADAAEDRSRAVELYQQLLEKHAGSEREAEAKERLELVSGWIVEEGPGKVCPPAPDWSGVAALNEEAAPKKKGPRRQIPLPSRHRKNQDPSDGPSDEGGSLGAWPWLFTASGAVMMVGGGIAAGIGAMPYFAHAEASAAIKDAQAQRSDATDLQRQQTESREAWESWAMPTTVVGGVLLGTGVLLTGAGVFMFFADGPAE